MSLTKEEALVAAERADNYPAGNGHRFFVGGGPESFDRYELHGWPKLHLG